MHVATSYVLTEYSSVKHPLFYENSSLRISSTCAAISLISSSPIISPRSYSSGFLGKIKQDLIHSIKFLCCCNDAYITRWCVVLIKVMKIYNLIYLALKQNCSDVYYDIYGKIKVSFYTIRVKKT